MALIGVAMSAPFKVFTIFWKAGSVRYLLMTAGSLIRDVITSVMLF